MSEIIDRRDPSCVAVWPGCASGEYDPRCCRFPKSCSAGTFQFDPPAERPPLTDATHDRLVEVIWKHLGNTTTSDHNARRIARAILAEFRPVASTRERLAEAVPALLDIRDAVLALHRKAGGAQGRYTCAECSHEQPGEPWPCATVRACGVSS